MVEICVSILFIWLVFWMLSVGDDLSRIAELLERMAPPDEEDAEAVGKDAPMSGGEGSRSLPTRIELL